MEENPLLIMFDAVKTIIYGIALVIRMLVYVFLGNQIKEVHKKSMKRNRL